MDMCGERFSDIRNMAGKRSPYYWNFLIIRRTNGSLQKIRLCKCFYQTFA